MVRWIVMRHAKTEQEPAHDDIQRALTPHGHEVALAQGRWLAEQGWNADTVLCSPATRAQETMHDAIAAWPRPQIDTIDALYGGDPTTYREALRDAPGDTVLLVGHDPTCTQLVLAMARDAPRKPNGKVMPTGTAACFEDGELAHLPLAVTIPLARQDTGSAGITPPRSPLTAAGFEGYPQRSAVPRRPNLGRTSGAAP